MSALWYIARPQLRRASALSFVRFNGPSLSACRSSTASTPPFSERKTSGARVPLRYVWYLLSLGIGVGSGFAVRAFTATRLDPPLPGSEQDEFALRALDDEMDELDIVKKMRAQGYNLHSDVPLDGRAKDKGCWIEIDFKENMTKTAAEGNADTRTLTQRSMAGIRGLGVQRAFWNTETRELVAVVWIGQFLSGWPGIAHGGALATLFEDAMSRMIAGPNKPIDSTPIPTSMSVTYARPTMVFNMHILRASFKTPDLPQDQPTPEPAPGKSWLPSWKDFTKSFVSTTPDPPIEIGATLEGLDGKVTVRAKGTWPASAIIQSNA